MTDIALDAAISLNNNINVNVEVFVFDTCIFYIIIYNFAELRLVPRNTPCPALTKRDPCLTGSTDCRTRSCGTKEVSPKNLPKSDKILPHLYF